MAESKIVSRLKEKWGITSNWQILIICIVFAVTGSTSMKIAGPVLDYVGIDNSLNPWIYWPVRIIAIFPVYQVLLIVFGTLCGQFKFFWAIEKKMFGRLFGASSSGIKKRDTIN